MFGGLVAVQGTLKIAGAANSRCGDVRGIEGQRASDFCHDLVYAHSAYPLAVKDIAWPE